MDRALFQQIFGSFDHPVLLKAGEEWLSNPAAQALCLSGADLQRLEEWGEDASLWLCRQFYHVTATQLDGSLLLLLRPDVFLSSAAENVASQLRVRLNAAFGSTSALAENKALLSDLRARENLSAVNQELYQILRMVMQLEHCGSAGAAPPRLNCVDLVQRFHRLAEEAGELCHQAGVKLTAETDLPSLPMLADGRQLDYLILNLISNALKSAPEKGGRITLSLKRQQEQAVITVADNAGGFPPDYLAHPLWNDPHRLIPRRGLGLGLPLVQRIAAAHEGALMVFPSSKGTRVVLSLPIRMPPESLFTQPEYPVEDAPGFSLSKILLSDALPRSVDFPRPSDDE